jgi:hypothetical protein
VAVTSTPEQLYRLKVGERIYENLSVAVIIKNIRSGKLKPEHLIARSGSESWKALEKVPQLARYFAEAEAARAAVPVEPAPAPQPKPRYFEILRGNEKGGPFTRQQITEQIKRGELLESHRIRPVGSPEWSMAGDLDDLRRHFDMRRQLVREKGFAGASRDTGTPFYIDLGAPFIYYGNMRFLINLIAILLFYALAFLIVVPIVSGPLMLLAGLYVYSYYFRVVGSTATGNNKFPEFSDLADIGSGLIRPSVQFLLTTIVSTLPLAAYIVGYRLASLDPGSKLQYVQVIYSVPWAILLMAVPTGFRSVPTMTMPALDGSGKEITIMEHVIPTAWAGLGSDPLVWLFLIFWFLYVPIALMRQAAYGEFMPTFNLPAVFISIARAFGPYMALLAFLLLIDLFAGAILFTLVFIVGLATLGPAGEGAMTVLGVPFQLAMQALGICATFLKMYFIGRFVFQYSDKMGWH